MEDSIDTKVGDNGIVTGGDDEAIATSRRKFVKAAGKIAVYTPPAMLLLMNPSARTFAQSSGVSDVGQGRRRRRRRNDDDD